MHDKPLRKELKNSCRTKPTLIHAFLLPIRSNELSQEKMGYSRAFQLTGHGMARVTLLIEGDCRRCFGSGSPQPQEWTAHCLGVICVLGAIRSVMGLRKQNKIHRHTTSQPREFETPAHCFHHHKRYLRIPTFVPCTALAMAGGG